MALPTPPVTTYAQFYEDPDNNPFDQYGPLYVPFSIDPADHASAASPAQVRAAFFESSAAGDPNAFLMLHPVDPTQLEVGPGYISCYHNLTSFPTRIGVPATR